MKLHEDVPLAPKTTLRVGGRAEQVYELERPRDVDELMDRTGRSLTELRILGRGSNVLIPDRTLQTPFVQLGGQFKEYEFTNGAVRAGSALTMPQLAMEAARRGFGGLEWAAGVPGTVGGAVAMNAGAFGRDTASSLKGLVCRTDEGGPRERDAEEFEFGYREWELRDRALVLEAEFALVSLPGEQAREETMELLKERHNSQPVGERSAGCMFKNPPGESAGALIDRAGLKGSREGPVVVASQHANYFVNEGGASCTQVRTLMDRVRERVLKQFDVELPLEIQVWDDIQ